MKSLADFRREVSKPGATLTLVKFCDTNTGQDQPHSFLGVARQVDQVRSTGFYLIGTNDKGVQRWFVEFGKASAWQFQGNLAISKGSWGLDAHYLVESVDQ